MTPHTNLFLIALFSSLTLVITSCDNSGSDATLLHVATKNQQATYQERTRGDEFLSHLKEMAQDKSVPDAQKKVIVLYSFGEQIDRLTSSYIRKINKIKKDLLVSIGADIKSIVHRQPGPTDHIGITEYNLEKVVAKGSTDILSDNSDGLLTAINSFRTELTELVAASSSNDQYTYFFKAPNIHTFLNFDDLNKQLTKSMTDSRISPDDFEMIRKIYCELSYDKTNWKKLFASNVDWVTAFGMLTSLQTELLKARANALAVIRYRTTGCDYSFNKIMVVAEGPEAVKDGAEFDIEVCMAAFDSYKQPIVRAIGGQLKETRDGKGIVHIKAPKGANEFTVAGTITILNKSGIPKTLPWEKKITVVR